MSDSAFEMLKQSITELGIIKPILVNRKNNIIIAGHQRTKAMTAVGLTETPAYILDGVGRADEIRFNQLHNACELEVKDEAPKMKICPAGGEIPFGYFRVNNADIHIIDKGKMQALTNTLAKLLIKYGEFGCPICTKDGLIHISSAYAYAAKVTGGGMDVLCLPDDKMERAKYFLSKSYGEFCYDNLEKTTWHQHFAQKKRLRDGKKGENNSHQSYLYRLYVEPYLKGHSDGKRLRIIDFGAGQKDYSKKLKKEGYDIIAVDPYHCKENTNEIDADGNTRDFIKIANSIKKDGLYDVVICDSVLNSVDSLEAERSVINTVRALCKRGGMIFISGRSYERENLRNSYFLKKQTDAAVKFYDKDLFSALFRDGEWFYQKFHTDEMVKNIAESIGAKSKIHYNSQAFSIEGIKDKDISIEDAISALSFEWNLPLPNNRRYGLSNIITDAYKTAISKN